MLRIGLFFLLSAWSWLASASIHTVNTDDGYDWIQLTSGEWIKGELVTLYEDEVTFDSDHFGIVKLDLDDVELLKSNSELTIRLMNNVFLTGRVKIDEELITIAKGSEERAATRDVLVAITPASVRERDNWEAELGFGATARRGNADTAETNILARMERRTTRTRLVADYLGNFQETDGEEIANNHRITARTNLFSGRRFFWRPFLGQFYRDPFQNIDQQWSIETGVGYQIRDTARTDWTIGAGAGVNFVRYGSVDEGDDRNNTSPAATLSTDFETELTNWMDYLFQMQIRFVDEDAGDYQHHILTTLSTDLIGDVDLDVSFVWDRIQSPQPRQDGTVPEQDDFRFVISVGYEF